MTLIRPIITEKSMIAATRGVFTFEVEPHVTKNQVREEVQTLFKVHVKKVTARNTTVPAHRSGARRLLGQSGKAHTMSLWLAAGEKIALFDIKEQK